ncbi:hypothetical protein CVT26_000756 [Gymnopilus dilepis]|uniref:Uncharacterized protein n=1 Tax=Gymnopilus dilepis TaxID=231916 RepID=A0A409Y2K4_9AGAR|nr:hypothetical protein CVT26_000756 [Gymnopilus dilepis]
MPDDDPPSYDIELPTITGRRGSPTSPDYAHVPLDVELGIQPSPHIPTTREAPSTTLAYPIPAHLSSSSSPTVTNSVQSVQHPTSTESHNEVDIGLRQYAQAHDRRGVAVTRRLPEADLLSLHSGHGQPEPLPAYGENPPPVYVRGVDTLRKEPNTLARYLFKYGFCASAIFSTRCLSLLTNTIPPVFPLFWIFGALLRLHPHSPLARSLLWRPDDGFIAWYNQNIRTEEDKAEFAARMREIEQKWSKRCGAAFVLFMCVCLAVGVTIFALLKVT